MVFDFIGGPHMACVPIYPIKKRNWFDSGPDRYNPFMYFDRFYGSVVRSGDENKYKK